MENFIINTPTVLHFGQVVIQGLGKTLAKYGKNVLFIYGKGSIKSNGIYQQVINQLNLFDLQYVEYHGIKANPIIEDVDKAAKLGKRNNVDVILAVGGGSVIDTAKIVSIAIPVKNPAWDFFEAKVKPEKSIPLITVLTFAGTGTEMNSFAVSQNLQTKQKLGYGNDLIYPKHSFLDPKYTFSVPKDQTAYGIVDLIAHSLEAFFGGGEATLSDRFVYSIIKEAIDYGPDLLNNLENYELRAKIMYAATAALNKLTFYGRSSTDWGVHSIGHVLSLLYDLPHGATLSIAYPAWLKLFENRIPERIIEMGENLFGVKTTKETISGLESFFKSLNCPLKLSETGIEYDKNIILKTMKLNKVNGFTHKISVEDYDKIIEFLE
ncbi:MAG: iron-containing alcohol dehydrogenase [Bacteroidales bacterium]|nr:iron-containing alcohol dehydrogenase [Bacteroidales bacterium]